MTKVHLAAWMGMVTGVLLGILSCFDSASATDRPNIVFMLADDQGWNGLSVAMHPDLPSSASETVETPNLELLARQGMRFSNAYAPAPVCSPTRISLQTGKSPAQLHWTKAAPPVSGQKLIEPRLIKSIASEEITLAEILKCRGYATAHYGKWHIGGGGPGAHGYDEHDGDTGNEHAFEFKDPNPVDIFGMAEKAERFMRQCQRAGKPFFIQLSWNALHAAENAIAATKHKYQNRMPNASEKAIATAAISEDLDHGVGRVMAALDRLGLTQNTYLIYMSDNGAGVGGKKNSLRGGKGGVWEGGLRVPFLVRGPGITANSWCHVPIVGYDLFPTFCQLAGLPESDLPKSLEGGTLVDLFSNDGKGEVRRRFDGLYFHFPHYQSDSPQASVRVDRYKLIRFFEDDRFELFDLSQDLGEKNNLAKTFPQVAADLNDRLSFYLNSIGAQLPTVNPDYPPGDKPVEKQRRNRRNLNEKPQGKRE